MKPLQTALPAALAVLTLMAGCGGGDDNATSANDEPEPTNVTDVVAESTPENPLVDTATPVPGAAVPDPCTLVTADEASAVIGASVPPASAVPLLGSEGLECTYAAEIGSSLAVRVEPGREAYDIGRDLGTGGFDDAGDIQDVSGLGETAYVGIGSYGPVRIAWYEDGLALTVEISDIGATEPRTVTEYEDVAHQVSDRIG